jgi:ketosteroid isomerase-like protein
MSQENVEVVRALFDAAARRDSATVLALYDPEVEWDNTRGRGSGVAVDLEHSGTVWTLRQGKIVRVRLFTTRAEALEAVGLRE